MKYHETQQIGWENGYQRVNVGTGKSEWVDVKKDLAKRVSTTLMF